MHPPKHFTKVSYSGGSCRQKTLKCPKVFRCFRSVVPRDVTHGSVSRDHRCVGFVLCMRHFERVCI